MNKKLILSLMFGMVLLVGVLTFVSSIEIMYHHTTGDQSVAGSVSTKTWINFTSTHTGYVVAIQKDDDNTATKCYIMESDRSVLTSGDFSGVWCNLSSRYQLDGSSQYLFGVDSDGSNYDATWSGEVYPYPSNGTFGDYVGANYHYSDGNNNERWEAIADIVMTNESAPPASILTTTSVVPEANANFTNQNVTFEVNIADPDSLGIINVTLILNGTINQTNASVGQTIFYVNIPYGYWNYSFDVYDGTGNLSQSTNGTINFSVAKMYYGDFTYNSTTGETAEETFYVNITTDGTVPSSAKFNYNGTDYTATITNTNGNFYNLSYTKQIPLGVGSPSFYFSTLIGGERYNSTNQSHQVNRTYLALCNSTYDIQYFNISFQDESDLSSITAQIPTSTFVYYLGDGTINKTLTFVNTTENLNYTFCATPTNKPMKVDSRIQYKASGYPQRVYNPDLIYYNGTTITNKVLYLLADADGLYVTFQVINLAEETISGVTVNATRTISGETVVVGDGTTDASGSVTFWLNPDFQHTLMFSKTGYTTTTYTVTPTQTSYTITLGESSSDTSDYTRGITKAIFPNQDFLDNGTVYDFNFTLTSSYWTVTEFGINITYQNGTVIGTNSSSLNGGSLSINDVNVSYSTYNLSKITMSYYYVINSTYINGSRTWTMQSVQGRSYSIWDFFSRLSSYIDSGNLFGFDNFGKILLSVILLVMVAGGASLRYGIRSDVFIMGIIFGIVLLLDFGLGWFGRIQIGENFAINNFPTFILGILLIATIIREERFG